MKMKNTEIYVFIFTGNTRRNLGSGSSEVSSEEFYQNVKTVT